MANIQFQEPQYARPGGMGPRRSWLASLVIKLGLAKDDAGAQKALLVILAVVFVAIILVWTI